MVHALYILASVGFFFGAFYTVLQWLKLLNEHDFRLSAVIAYLKTPSGRNQLITKRTLCIWVLLASYPFVIFHETYFIYYYAAIAYLFTYDVVATVTAGVTKRVHTLFTKDFVSIGTTLLTILSLMLLYYLSPLDAFLWLLILSQCLLIIIVMWTMILTIINEFYWDYRATTVAQGETPQTIVLMGNEEVRLVGYYLYEMLSEPSLKIVLLHNPHKKNVIPLLMPQQTNTYFIITLNLSDRDVIDIMLALINPSLLVMTSLPDKDNSDRQHSFVAPLLQDALSAKARFYVPRGSLLRKYIPHKQLREVDPSPKKAVVYKEKTKLYSPLNGAVVETPILTERAVSITTVHPLLQDLGVDVRTIQTKSKLMQRPRGFLDMVLLSHVSHLYYGEGGSLASLALLTSYITLYRDKKILIIDIQSYRADRQDAYHKRGVQIGKVFDYIFILPGKYASVFKSGIQTKNKQTYVSILPLTKIQTILPSLLNPHDIVVYAGSQVRELFHTYSGRAEAGL